MFNAILFDLDGTLLLNDTDTFIKCYFSLLMEEFKKKNLGDANLLFQSLQEAVKKMMQNRGPKSNEEVFWGEFERLTERSRKDFNEFFNNFYLNIFPKIKDLGNVKPHPYAREIVQRSFDLGLKVIIATNPVFPLIAIKERLSWAGLSEFPFHLITSMEIMHACKPFPEYYKEILEKIEEKPEKAIMVGNDVEEDLPAGRLGITTFLVTESQLINYGKEDLRPDLNGTLKDLYEILPKLTKS
ncbi:MAG TPA: HAD family hydrolase [Dictyoglomaceae bacterium]|nr:HAD family hydrolase [Dictyoglomaceae bacterium]HOL39360.1 HAD family hydrolase [Dictyoglomaceae bacterium]HOP94825.1 HAD family hydrolase [Dictyoglomaceae bacterium]HPP15958.1 HAD family hydrolase [Dictyoglomaceae bacterium]HPU43280.1 HAD family hydrolase [Dictyoglomaceae bacterium]